MAQISLTLRLELDPLQDAVADVGDIHAALRFRHGDRFRKLEHRIEAWATGPTEGLPTFNLEPGVIIAGVPPVLASLLAEARALGVVPDR